MKNLISSTQIVLTESMIKNGYISIDKDFFPKDTWRYKNTPRQAMLINLNINDEYSIRTEYSIQHNGLRRLTKIRRFFDKYGITAGHIVVIMRMGLYDYKLVYDAEKKG